MYVYVILMSIHALNISFPNLYKGYDRSLHDGHLSLPNPKPITGYWGEDGYRRNTFDLRRRPSVFDDPDDG